MSKIYLFFYIQYIIDLVYSQHFNLYFWCRCMSTGPPLPVAPLFSDWLWRPRCSVHHKPRTLLCNNSSDLADISLDYSIVCCLPWPLLVSGLCLLAAVCPCQCLFLDYSYLSVTCHDICLFIECQLSTACPGLHLSLDYVTDHWKSWLLPTSEFHY